MKIEETYITDEQIIISKQEYKNLQWAAFCAKVFVCHVTNDGDESELNKRQKRDLEDFRDFYHLDYLEESLKVPEIEKLKGKDFSDRY